ncbi:MAG: B12-binding domain-containing radical SAM protein [Candidatus Omnitrophica bacterium]|nr:B12-binding domain-containing radical SAM protein [Candidatus Omnitrophota bacterium]
MIEVILLDNTRPECGGSGLMRYSAAGVFLSLLKNGFDARMVDFLPRKEMPRVHAKKLKTDVCCYALFFGNKSNVFAHMHKMRQRKNPPSCIIVFGPFASVFKEEILLRQLADVVVLSDPEFVLPMLLHKGVCPKVPNICYLKENTMVETSRRVFKDLDDIPPIGTCLYKQGHRPVSIMTSRGCRHHCVFCDRHVLWGQGVRARSIVHVLDEIKELVEIHHAQRVRFLDEDLAWDKKRLVELCEGLRKINGSFIWECSLCVDSVSRKLLLLMAHSHCRAVSFGVESASVRVLKKLGKKYGSEEILNAVRWAKEARLHVEVMMTNGNPGETKKDRDKTLSVLQKMGSGVTVRTNKLVILPGTAFYQQGLKQGRFTKKSFFEDEGLIYYEDV